MLYVATGSGALRRRRAGALRRRRGRALQRDRPRPGPRHDLAPALDRRAGLLRPQRRARAPTGLRLVPARQEPLLDRERRLLGHRPRGGDVQLDGRHASSSPTCAPTSSSRRSRRSSGSSARRRCSSSSCSSSCAACASRCSAQDGFSKLLAAGLTFGFALQTFIIVGGVLRVVPLTGITLPFVSYGGTSIVANFVLLALLLLVSNRANALGGRDEPADRRLTYVALGLVTVLVVMTTYWQTWASAGARGAAGQRDPVASPSSRSTAGSSSPSSRASVLARNVEREVDGKTLFFRRYPYGPLAAHVVGYSTVGRSRTGLERSLNDYLTASNANLSTVVDKALDELRGKPIQGNDVVTTLDLDAQEVALEQLGTNCGAVVALDPRTGRVLVMASSPSFDPNLVEDGLRRRSRRSPRLHAGGAAPQPRQRRALRPRLDLQGDHRRRGARVRRSTRPSRRSSIPATAPCTGSG